MGAATGLPGRAGAQEVLPSEYQMKAAYLYNFAKFVEWPTNALPADAPLVIGVLGDDPFDGFLDDTIRGKQINGRRLLSEHVQTPEQARTCQILFVSSSEKKHWPDISTKLDSSSVLTVSEKWSDFTAQGGIINLFVEDRRVCFDINNESARRVGLRISSKLLLLRKKPAS